jgi:hypothetical protein
MRSVLTRRGAISAIALLLAVSIGACGSSESSTGSGVPSSILDTETVERAIRQSILSQRDLRAKVSCPAVVPQEEGRNFTCVATAGKTKTIFTVTQTDDDGNVTYRAR